MVQQADELSNAGKLCVGTQTLTSTQTSGKSRVDSRFGGILFLFCPSIDINKTMVHGNCLPLPR